MRRPQSRLGEIGRSREWAQPPLTRLRISATKPSVRTSRAAAGCVLGRFALGHLERMAAAARGDGVRVLDLEPRLLDRLEVVDLRTHQVGRAEGIHDDLDALALELVIPLLGAAVEAEPVLEAGAATALDRDSQHRDVLLRGHEAADLHRRRRRQRDDALGALPNIHPHRIVATWLLLTRSRGARGDPTL